MFTKAMATSILLSSAIIAVVIFSINSSTYGRTWKELLDVADSLQSAQIQDSAIIIGGSALESAQMDFGANDTASASVLFRLGTYHHFRGDFNQADTCYKMALAIRERILGRDHLDVASCLNNLAILYSGQGSLGDNDELFNCSPAIQEKAPDTDRHRIWGVLMVAGDWR